MVTSSQARVSALKRATLAATLLTAALIALLSPARAAAKAPPGSLTQLHGQGYCLGGGCTRLRPFTRISGTDDYGIPISFTLSTNGRTLYAVSDDPGAIAVLARNPHSGKLTQVPGKLGCISAKLSSGCTHLARLYGAATIVVSGDGTRIAVAPTGYGNGTSYLYARNPKTGAIRQLETTKTGCIELLNGGPCLRARHLTGTPTQLSSTTLATVGYVPGASVSGGEIMLWHRANAKARWRNDAGPAGCANVDGSANCLKVPCMDDYPTFVLRSADRKRLYVVGGYPDNEDSPESYIATFALGSNGDITSLLGCTQAGTDSTGQGYAALWAQLNPSSGQLLLLLGRGNRGDGQVWTRFAISTPGTNGALQTPIAASARYGGFDYPAPISLAPGGKSLTWVDGDVGDSSNLDVFRVSKTAISPFPAPYFRAFKGPLEKSGNPAGYVAAAQVRSPDNRFVYLGLTPGYFAPRMAAQIRVYRVH